MKLYEACILRWIDLPRSLPTWTIWTRAQVDFEDGLSYLPCASLQMSTTACRIKSEAWLNRLHSKWVYNIVGVESWTKVCSIDYYLLASSTVTIPSQWISWWGITSIFIRKLITLRKGITSSSNKAQSIVKLLYDDIDHLRGTIFLRRTPLESNISSIGHSATFWFELITRFREYLIDAWPSACNILWHLENTTLSVTGYLCRLYSPRLP